MTPSLTRAPNSNDKHLWADYFELVCLLSQEGRLSRGDVEEHAEQLTDLETDSLQAEPPAGATAAELVDGRKLAVSDLFGQLKYRERVFGAAYPFRLASGGRALELAELDSETARMHVSLCAAANRLYARASRRTPG